MRGIPKYHTRSIIGANPYGNGSYGVSHANVESEMRKLFCAVLARRSRRERLANSLECRKTAFFAISEKTGYTAELNLAASIA